MNQIKDQWLQQLINTAAAIVIAIALFVVVVFSIVLNFL